jgi:phage-related protein
MRLHRALRPASAVVAGVALLFLAGCGSSSTSGSTATTSPASAPTTTATPRPGCADVEALKSSLDALTKINPLQDGLMSLNAAIADVKAKLDVAAASAGADLQPAVEQVKTAFTALQTAMTGVTTDNLRQKLPAISTALQQVGTSTASLATTLMQKCPSG